MALPNGIIVDRPTCVDVLSYYNTHAVKHIAVALVIADQFPKEILNEIRAAFTHTAKANALEGEEAYFTENRNALRHLKRVCLDCLKVALVFLAERVEGDIDLLTNHTRLPQSAYSRAEELRRERLRILSHEAMTPTLHTIDALEALVFEYDSFQTSLRTEFGGFYGDAIERKAKRNQRRYMWQGAFIGALLGAILGIGGSIVAAYAYDALKNGTATSNVK